MDVNVLKWSSNVDIQNIWKSTSNSHSLNRFSTCRKAKNEMTRGGRKRSSQAEDVSSRDRGVPTPQTCLQRRGRGGGPAVLHTRQTGGCHLPVADDVLQRVSEREVVVSQDEATSLFRGSSRWERAHDSR